MENLKLSDLEQQLNEHGETLDEEEINQSLNLSEARGNDFLSNLEKSLTQGKPIDESVEKVKMLNVIDSVPSLMSDEDRFENNFETNRLKKLNEIKTTPKTYTSTSSNINENTIRKIVIEELTKNKELLKENFNKINETIYESYIDTVLSTLIREKVKPILEENNRLKKNQGIIIKALKKRGLLK